MSQIITITSQPAVSDIVSVYRPIIFEVNVSDTAPPKVVYCDVYVNDVYYRTLSKTQYKKFNIGSTDWQFDIQDPCQEVLKRFLPAFGGDDVLYAGRCSAVVSCRFRGSTIDGNGILVPEAPVPVQGTSTVPPVAGGGLQSHAFYILNVALQHHHNQILSAHLNAYKNANWNADAFPMSHRANNYPIAVNQNDYYPIFYRGNNKISKLRIYYRNRGQSTWFNTDHTVSIINDDGDINGIVVPSYNYRIVVNGNGTQTVTFYFPTPSSTVDLITIRYNDGTNHDFPGATIGPRSITIPVGAYTYSIIIHSTSGGSFSLFDTIDEIAYSPRLKGVYYIPDGPRNLSSLFPTITWLNLSEYYLEIYDQADALIATTVVNKLQEWVNEDHVRLYFLNYLGTYDAVNFLKPKGTLEDTSSEFQASVNYPLKKSDASINRFNVRSNETKETLRKSDESEMQWLTECKQSIEAYIDFKGTEGQNDDYTSVVIINGKMETVKNDRDYSYDFILNIKLANELFSVRK